MFVFVAACVAANRSERPESPERERTELPFPAPEPKFLCPDCVRTKRPRLDRILALLVSTERYNKYMLYCNYCIVIDDLRGEAVTMLACEAGSRDRF